MAKKKTKKKLIRTKKVEREFAPSTGELIDVKPVSTTKPKIAPKKILKKPTPPKATSENVNSNLPSVAAESHLVSQDPLMKYLSEIRKYPLLTPDEEHELAIRYKEKGDKEAAEKLVTSNLRFVVKVAAEYSKFGAKMIDLIQEGNVGLMHAVKEFNPYKGVRLITYAVWWIKGYIREYLMRQHSLVRIGTTQNQKKLFYNLQQEARKLEALGEDAAIEVLSQRLGIPEDEIKEMKQRLEGKDVSLDQPIDDDSGTSLISFQKDASAESPEDTMISSEQVELLREKIDKVLPLLNEKEKFILDSRLLSDEPLTLQEIGDKYKITRERARQLEERVMDKIKKAFQA